MDGALTTNVAGERLRLLPQRALHWRSKKALILTDLHLGRAESLQKSGIAIPSGSSENRLKKLEELLEAVSPEKLWILGDLFHRKTSLTPNLMQAFEDKLKSETVETTLIPGNHDLPFLDQLSSLPLSIHPKKMEIEPFVFSHEPLENPKLYNIAGHLHPTVSLETRAEKIRRPCFRFHSKQGLLPAFTELANGVKQKCDNGQIFIALEHEVIPLQDK